MNLIEILLMIQDSDLHSFVEIRARLSDMCSQCATDAIMRCVTRNSELVDLDGNVYKLVKE